MANGFPLLFHPVEIPLPLALSPLLGNCGYSIVVPRWSLRCQSIERSMLGAIAGGADLDDIAPDWVALQRLRQFGLIDEISQGHRVTAAGRRVLASGREP